MNKNISPQGKRTGVFSHGRNPFDIAAFTPSMDSLRITILGRYRKLLYKLSLSMIFALLLTTCSAPTTGEQPATPTTALNTISPMQTIPIPTTLPDPTIKQTPTATEQPTIGSTRTSEVDQMVQVYVPAGEFIMGSNHPDDKKSVEGGRAYVEIPVHTVSLDGYWIDKYEITNGQYKACVDADVCQPPHITYSATRPKYFGNPEYSNYPVIWVSWYMARTYCEWVGRRLPTEAEWEKAARGTDGRRYPWGNEELSGERANFCDANCPLTIANFNYNDGYADTAPVGSFPAGASPYGALDMAGNVWEWTSTIVQLYPYDANDGREDLNVRAERIWRGGPWSNGVWWMHSAIRYRSVQWYWNWNLGIRCASSS
jgi:serine/threonine-protein kinase